WKNNAGLAYERIGGGGPPHGQLDGGSVVGRPGRGLNGSEVLGRTPHGPAVVITHPVKSNGPPLYAGTSSWYSTSDVKPFGLRPNHSQALSCRVHKYRSIAHG